LAWGFHNEAWRVDLVDGRRVAITRSADGRTAGLVARMTTVGCRLRAAGVPVPAVLDPGWRTDAVGLMASEFVDGEVGAALLDRPGGPATVGAALGDAWRALQAADAEGLDLSVGWCSSAGLDAAGDAVARAIDRVGEAARPRLGRELAVARETLAGRRVGLVHGDLVPVNAIIRDGRLVGLVDLEWAARADPLADAAWFLWIVGYHHPSASGSAWGAFLDASGIDPGDRGTRMLLRTLPAVTMLERLEAAGEGMGRDHWVRLLRRFAGMPGAEGP
jgi:aminoglycoside phosphotransferase (APT) family kinase protein